MKISDYTDYESMLGDLIHSEKYNESLKAEILRFKRALDSNDIHYDAGETERDGRIVSVCYGDEWGKCPGNPEGEFIAWHITFDYYNEKILSCDYEH